jgi:gas vesicle protein
MKEQPPYVSSLLWALAGGIVGGALGLILAPQSGQETRQLMARKIKGGADSVRDLRDRVVDRGSEAWDEATLRAREAAAALAGTKSRTSEKGDLPLA